MMKWNYIWNHWISSFYFIGPTETWLDVDKEEFYDLNGYTSVNRYIKKTRRVVVSQFISYRVLLLRWEMTSIILTARWKLFLLKLTKVFTIRVQTLSLGLYIACLILQLILSMSVYLTYWMLYKKSINFVTCWEILILNFWKLMSIEPQANNLMYHIAAMYLPWSRNLRE